MNYKKVVTNYDVGIMKALTINFDLMENIKCKISELQGAFEYTTNKMIHMDFEKAYKELQD